MGIFSDLFAYANTVGYNWFAIMGAVAFMTGDMLGYFGIKKRLDKLVPARKRRQLEVVVMVAVVFYAGFDAWDAQYTDAQKVQSALDKASGVIATLQNNIDGDGGFKAQVARLQNELATVQQQRDDSLKSPPKVPDPTIVNQIALFMRDATQIQNAWLASDDTAAMRASRATWESKVLAYLSSKLDPSFAVQFAEVQYTGSSLPNNHSVDGGMIYQTIQVKKDALASFMIELRRAP